MPEYKFNVYGGTRVSVSASLPATYNQDGFEALTYTEIGSAVSMSALGREFTDVTVTYLAQRSVAHRKGTYDYDMTELTVTVDEADAGQDILILAEQSPDNFISFKIVYSNGSTRYFTSQIWSYKEQGGDANAPRQVVVKFSVDARGFVEVPVAP